MQCEGGDCGAEVAHADVEDDIEDGFTLSDWSWRKGPALNKPSAPWRMRRVRKLPVPCMSELV